MHILDEDIPKFLQTIEKAIVQLNSGIKRIELEIDIGDGIPIAKITGYWIVNAIRIDIKFKR